MNPLLIWIFKWDVLLFLQVLLRDAIPPCESDKIQCPPMDSSGFPPVPSNGVGNGLNSHLDSFLDQLMNANVADTQDNHRSGISDVRNSCGEHLMNLGQNNKNNVESNITNFNIIKSGNTSVITSGIKNQPDANTVLSTNLIDELTEETKFCDASNSPMKKFALRKSFSTANVIRIPVSSCDIKSSSQWNLNGSAKDLFSNNATRSAVDVSRLSKLKRSESGTEVGSKKLG